jgi:uncharacterized hydrophobic protein (TIGR00341 family)
LQIVHATFRPGEGDEAVELLETLGIDIEDYKLLETKTGDLLIINLLYGDTNVLLDNLASHFDFEDDEERSLVIFTPDTVVPRNEDKVQKASFRATRETIITFAQNNSKVNIDYLMLVAVSAVITSLGLMLNNVAVVVGGMVIAPVLGPILAVTIGIMLGDSKLIKKGIATEIMASVVAILIGFLFGSLLPQMEVTNALRIRMFPTLADLFIALAAGAAAAYALVRGHLESGLVGVMVAAALLPVMCTIGIGISMGNQTMILGALLLLGGNFLGLLLSNMIVFYFEGLKPQIWYKFKANKLIKKSLIFIIVAVIIFSIPLGILTFYQFYVEKPVGIVKQIVRDNLGSKWDYRVERVELDGKLVTVFIYADDKFNEEVLKNIKKQISSQLAKEYNIIFKIIPIEKVYL